MGGGHRLVRFTTVPDCASCVASTEDGSFVGAVSTPGGGGRLSSESAGRAGSGSGAEAASFCSTMASFECSTPVTSGSSDTFGGWE